MTLGSLKEPRPSLVAIKVASNDKSSNILLEEAKIMARLDHVNVVKILMFQRQPMKIVMEFVEGGDLRRVIEVGNATWGNGLVYLNRYRVTVI